MGRRGDVADGSASATLASESPPSSPNTALAGAPAPFFADGHVVPTFQDRERAVQQIVRLMKAQFVIPPVRALTTLVVFERDRPGGPDLEACARYFEHAFPPPPRGQAARFAAVEAALPRHAEIRNAQHPPELAAALAFALRAFLR